MAEEIRLDQEAIDLLARCSVDTKMHSQYFFPDIFSAAYSKLHDQIVSIIDEGHPRTVIAAPRGLGKTSTVLFGVVSRHMLFNTKKFVIYLTNSGDNAILQTENLKHELLANEMVNRLFGSIKFRYEDSLDDRFSKKAWVSSGGTFILPRGAGQQVRGLLYHSNRPDLLVIDDLEDSEMVQSDIQRKKLKNWFFADVMKCISRYDNNYQFIYIDTLKHEDSLLQELLESPEWLGVRLDICDDNYNSNAPSYMTTEEIKKEIEEHKRKGMLDVFYREMRNIPVAKETQTFKEEYFRYYTEVGEEIHILSQNGPAKVIEKIRLKDIVTVIIIDPAKEVQIQNADTAIVGIGVHRDSKKIFIRAIDADKMLPDDIYKRAFKMARELRSNMIFYEKTSLHRFIEQPFENQRRIENWVGTLEALDAVGKKEERVAHLAPYYKQGYVYHRAGYCDRLEAQLLGFPRSRLWDVMDATAYIIKVMDEKFIYFDSGDSLDEPLRDEYDELDPEPELRYATFI